MSKSARIKPPRCSSSGQALLIILLVMTVVLTIALAVVSRSITGIATSTREEEAARAFSAAEAGIEQALLTQAPASDTLPTGESYSAQVYSIAAGGETFAIPYFLTSGDVFPVWFVSHLADGSLGCNPPDNPCFSGGSMKVCWGEAGTGSGDSVTPAIELSVLYDAVPGGDYADVRIARAAFDPNSSRRSSNNFSPASGTCSISGTDYEFSADIGFAGLGVPCTGISECLLTARIKMLYNDPSQPGGKAHKVGVDVSLAGSVLPSQGTLVESVGTSGEAERRIEVYQLFSDLPPIFDYGAFTSSGGLVK